MASHPSPFHRQRQSNKTLDPTGQTAKFLYTILKQLDLKNIDWNEVASGLDITNGHAARMRWSRFRAQIEGLDNSYSRKGGKKKDTEKKRKKDEKDVDDPRRDFRSREIMEGKRAKIEADGGYNMENWLSSKSQGFGYGHKNNASMQNSDFVRLEDQNSRHENKNVGTGSGGRVLGSVKEEVEEKISVINGTKVHHPSISTITIPQPKFHHPSTTNMPPSKSPNALDSTRTTGLRGGSSGQMRYPFTARESPSQQSSVHPSISTRSYHWQQPYHMMSYPQQYRSNTTVPGHEYHPYVASRYPHPSAYTKPSPLRYAYGRQPMLAPFQQQQPYSYTPVNHQSLINPAVGSVISSNDHAIQGQDRSLPGHVDENTNAAPDLALLQNEDQLQLNGPDTMMSQLHEQAYDLASQASYPWPCTEASLSQFVSELSNPTDLESGINQQNLTNGTSDKADHTQKGDLEFATTIASIIQEGCSNSSAAVRANLCQTDSFTVRETNQVKDTLDATTTTQTTDPVEQSQDDIDMTKVIKSEPAA